MKWASLFSRTILSRGKLYYNNGHVTKLRKNGSQYTASVAGSKTYHVSITIEHDSVTHMECDCPYACDGHTCKHMAAALYHIEDLYGMTRKQESLFPEGASAEDCPDGFTKDFMEDFDTTLSGNDAAPQAYSFFNVPAMKQAFSWSVEEWRAAVQMAQRGQVVLDSVDVGFPRSIAYYVSETRHMLGTATGKFIAAKNSYPVTLHFDRNQILNAECGVRGCNYRYSTSRYGNNSLCIHQTALLSLLETYLKKHDLGDATDWSGSQFLNMFQARRANRIMAETGTPKQPTLTLFPRIHVDWSRWSASFRIGPENGKKTFVIKNLTELISQVKEKENVVFGSSTEWNLAREHFSEAGCRFLDFIQNIIDEEYRRAEYSSHRTYISADTEITVTIPLYGKRLDDFCEAVGSGSMERIEGFGKDKKTAALKFRNQKPKLHLQIAPSVDSEGIFQGISLCGDIPSLLYGQKAAYYIERNYINRVDMACLNELEPLFLQENQGKIQLEVGRKRLSEFYYTVLPWLRSLVSVTEKDPEKIQEYLPPKVHFTFYLDAEDGNVFCQADAVYGETHVPVTDVLRQNDLAAEGRPSSEMAEYGMASFRDIDREGEIAYRVLQFLPYPDPEQHTFHCGRSEELICRFLEEGLESLAELGEVQVTDRFHRLKVYSRPRLTVGVSIDSQLVNLSITSDEIPAKELMAVLGSYRKRRKYHRLKNGAFLKLEDDSFEVLAQMVDALHLSTKELAKGAAQIPLYRALYLEKMLEQHNSIQANRDSHFEELINRFQTISASDFEVPSSLGETLRPYQAAGYRWLRTLAAYGFGGILADDMGLGKTLQVIALLLSEKGTGRGAGQDKQEQDRSADSSCSTATACSDATACSTVPARSDVSACSTVPARSDAPALIIAPASLTYNWLDEFHRFAPELTVCLVTGTPQERIQKLQDCRSFDVLITSYDLLKRDITEYEAISFSYEILDEAQYIKNHTTAVSKAVRVIKSRIRFALTGTPIENRLSELWSIFDYLMPGFLYSYEEFKRDFEAPIVKNGDADVSGRLKRMVSPFILRRLKEDVLKELPDKLEEVRYARFAGEQQQLYDGQVLHMKQMIDDQDEEHFRKNKLRILSELTRIRQICCDPSLCFEDYRGESAKRQASMDLIQSAIEGEHKVLVFSQFASMLELLEQDLSLAGISYFKITGSTPKEQRLQMVKSFYADTTPVFLISLKAGGTGLNLTGADVVIHYDPWWNLAVQNQATDRTHRIGQTKIVTVYKLIMKDSIEERILQMQAEKKNLADEILNGENGTIGHLSKEELLALLKN